MPSGYTFQHSDLHMDTDRQPQGGSSYGSSCDSFNSSAPRVVPAAAVASSQHGMPPLDLPHSSLSRKASVAPTSGGSSQPAAPNLVRLPSLLYPSPDSQAHTRTQARPGWRWGGDHQHASQPQPSLQLGIGGGLPAARGRGARGGRGGISGAGGGPALGYRGGRRRAGAAA